MLVLLVALSTYHREGTCCSFVIWMMNQRVKRNTRYQRLMQILHRRGRWNRIRFESLAVPWLWGVLVSYWVWSDGKTHVTNEREYCFRTNNTVQCNTATSDLPDWFKNERTVVRLVLSSVASYNWSNRELPLHIARKPTRTPSSYFANQAFRDAIATPHESFYSSLKTPQNLSSTEEGASLLSRRLECEINGTHLW
jgi:hypothetical protein